MLLDKRVRLLLSPVLLRVVLVAVVVDKVCATSLNSVSEKRGHGCVASLIGAASVAESCGHECTACLTGAANADDKYDHGCADSP